MKFYSSTVIAALAFSAAGASALSIGNLQGEAVVGQPLSLTFDVALDRSEVSSCATAEVSYGDTRIDAGKVQVQTRPSPEPGHALIGVRSAVPVNEPIVAITLRAGCESTIARRYTLLTDFALEGSAFSGNELPEVARSIAPARQRSLDDSEARREGPGTTARNLTGSNSFRNHNRGSSPIETSPAVQGARRSQNSLRKAAQLPDSAGASRSVLAGPRLELQTAGDWLEEQTLRLQPSALLETPAGGPASREAAETVWREISGEGKAAAASSTGNLKKMIADAEQSAERSRAVSTTLRQELSVAEKQKYNNWLVWSLAALCLIALGFISWIAAKRRREPLGAWWSGDVAMAASDLHPPNPTPVEIDSEQPISEFLSEEAASGSPQSLEEAPGPMVHRDRISASVVPSLSAAVVGAKDVSNFHLSEDPKHAVRLVSPLLPSIPVRLDHDAKSTKMLLREVQQNAELHVSVGQHEEAIELLHQFVASHPLSGPLPYLDLFKILHTLSLTEAYRKLRTDFNQKFNAEVPPFALFRKSDRRLESYTEVMQRITRAWGSDNAANVIESLMTRREAGSSEIAPFELEAFRELLLLKEIAEDETAGAGAGSKVQSRAEGRATEETDSGVSRVDAISFLSDKQRGSTNGTRVRPSISVDFELPLQESTELFGSAGTAEENVSPHLPTVERSSASAAQRGFGPEPVKDDNLIDFDLFDIDLVKTKTVQRR